MHGPGVTPETCIIRCRSKGYSYAGLQMMDECWCGNKYGKYGRTYNCNMKCGAVYKHKVSLCGGANANLIFSTS